MVDKPIPKFELDERSDLPIWVQIRDRFVYLIDSGYYVPGDQLPSVRKVAAEREKNDENYLGFVEIGKNADAAFNAYVADYTKNGYANANAAAQSIIACFTDHNHYANGTLACDLMLNGYGNVEGIVAQMVKILNSEATGINIAKNGKTLDAQNGTETIYNLNGQRVATTAKGLYIINGKKVIIK